MSATRSSAASAAGATRPTVGKSGTRAYEAQATVAVFSALTLLFVGMRVYTRITAKGNWGPDDCERATPLSVPPFPYLSSIFLWSRHT
jgi:hypothetical protein